MSTDIRHSGQSQRARRSDRLRNDELVFAAARDVFSELGPQAGVDDVAGRAGVGVATIYRRFATKEELLDAVAEQLAYEIYLAVVEACAEEDAGHGLQSFLEFVGGFHMRERRCAAKLIGRDAVHGVGAATAQKLEELVSKAVSTGSLATNARAADVKTLIVALQAVVASAPDGDVDSWRRFLRLHLSGLRTTF